MKKCVLISVFIAVILITGCRATGSECMNHASNIVSAEEQEAWKEWTIERSSTRNRYYLEYLVRGNFVPAAYDTDLQTIERFIFYHGAFFGGFGIVIDIMHGMIYYDPFMFSSATRLNSIPFSAEFIEEDFTSMLIQSNNRI